MKYYSFIIQSLFQQSLTETETYSTAHTSVLPLRYLSSFIKLVVNPL